MRDCTLMLARLSRFVHRNERVRASFSYLAESAYITSVSFKLLGQTSSPCHIVNSLNLLYGIQDTNRFHRSNTGNDMVHRESVREEKNESIQKKEPHEENRHVIPACYPIRARIYWLMQKMNGLTWNVLDTLKVNVILPTTRMTMIPCTLHLPWMTSNANHKHGSLKYDADILVR